MRRVAIVAIIAIASGLCSEQVAAQDATGLYEPFPDPEAAKQSKRFVEQLPGGLGRFSEDELEQGRFVGASLPPSGPIRLSSTRAEPAEAGGWLAAGVGAGLLTLVWLLPRRRRRRPRGRPA